MIETSGIPPIITAHILQFSLAISVVAGIIWFTARRWPHFTFLVCMLALAKCLVPPLITSPAGVFTRTSGLAFSPQLDRWKVDQVVQLKRFAQPVSDPEACDASASTYTSLLDLPSTLGATGWALSLLCLWLLGVIVVLTWAGRQYGRLHQVVLGCRPAPIGVRKLAEDVQRQLGIRKPVNILVSDENYGPATLGCLRPKLILPETLVAAWSDRLIRPVLAHELAHARRGDLVWGYLQFVAQVVWWFHPLVWWLGRRAHFLCERCCDEEVVALTDCKAGDYAESLVRVLAFKSTFRRVPLCRSISAVEITNQRLERLMRKCGRYSQNSARVNWLLIAMLAVLVIPGMQWVTGQSAQAEIKQATVSEQEFRAKINKIIAEGKWGEAINLLRPVVEKDPQNGGAIFYLGYVLHAAGELDEALVYHQRAAKFDQLKPLALYNWACALALQGKQDDALAKLEEAIDAGFVHQSDLTDDSDLKSLFDTEKFKQLRQRTNHQADSHQPARHFDFWIGNWSVTNADGVKVGTNRITATENGHVLVENWTGARGSSGTSINYFHPGTKKWKQTWVDNKGGVIEYEGEFRDGKMQFEGTLYSSDGAQMLSRMTFSPNDDGSVEQFIESSKDGGENWETYFKGTYRRPGSSNAF